MFLGVVAILLSQFMLWKLEFSVSAVYCVHIGLRFLLTFKTVHVDAMHT